MDNQKDNSKEQLRNAFNAGQEFDADCFCGKCDYCAEKIEDYPDFEKWYSTLGITPPTQLSITVSDVDKLAEEKYPHIKKSSVEYKRVSELEAYLTVFLSQNDAEYASFEQSFRAAAYVGANWQRDAVATNYEKIIGLIKGEIIKTSEYMENPEFKDNWVSYNYSLNVLTNLLK